MRVLLVAEGELGGEGGIGQLARDAAGRGGAAARRDGAAAYHVKRGLYETSTTAIE